MKYPHELQSLITLLRKLPSVGSKSAERFAFALLDWSTKDLLALSSTLGLLKTEVQTCSSCGCLKDQSECLFCKNRDPHTLCIIGSPKDAFTLEDTHSYNGLYHVIETLLSPLDGRTPEQLDLDKLTHRITSLGVREVIIALDSTLEGDATSLYLKNHLDSLNLSVTRLAFGMPMGSTLDFVDEGTLSLALSGRRTF